MTALTTPFGRRPVTLAMMAAQLAAKACPPEQTVHKWALFRDLTEAKDRLGISDRALAVLQALLSFHQETALTGGDLIVYPSNRELALRAHGIAPATLRRHLAALVEAGLIIRRDSPNGKRYVRRARGEQIGEAFGFDLSILVARAGEIQRLAEEVREERREAAMLRERITVLRRDIAKMVGAAEEEGLAGPWRALRDRLRPLLAPIARSAGRQALEAIAATLGEIHTAATKCFEEHILSQNMSGNESQTERHYQNSNTDPSESEPSFQESRPTEARQSSTANGTQPPKGYPLGMVLEACPSIADYARDGIRTWRDFVDTAGFVRSMLGVSPSAWEEACEVMGPEAAAAVIAAILERHDQIRSAGGYLRSLTDKARAGEFSLGPVLMALLRRRLDRHRVA
jgi:replication initiation protein RepC